MGEFGDIAHNVDLAKISPLILRRLPWGCSRGLKPPLLYATLAA